MLRRLAGAMLALAFVGIGLGVVTHSSQAATTTTTTPPQTTGFVGRKGTQLVVGSQPWKFAGYNLPCAQPFQLTAGQLGYYLDNIQLNSGANVIRAWFFQSNGGPGNWTGFDQVVAALKARDMRVIPTLTNEFGACEPNPAGHAKQLAWYQNGYTQPNDGYSLSFRDFATQVASHYANVPTIAFWQLVNEADASGPTGCAEAPATAALRSFADDMTNAIRKVDPNHLVSLGTIGTGQCGTDGSTDYRNVHAGALDLCEYHDYGSPTDAMPSDGANLLKERITDCQTLGKPIFVGESGIVANVQPDGTPSPCSPWPGCSADPVSYDTLNRRASLFKAKIDAGRDAGLVGYVIWLKSPFYTTSTDAFAIGDGDPSQATLADALQPGPPTVSVPESPWPILLGVSAVVLFGLATLRWSWRWRRRQAQLLR